MAIRRAIGRRLEHAVARYFDLGPSAPDERYRLTLRLNSLIERLRDRLDSEVYGWATEYSGQTEWELAIATIRHSVRDGSLQLHPEEAGELEAIEAKVNRRLLRQLLTDHR